MQENQLDTLWEDMVKYLQNHGTEKPKETVERWQRRIADYLDNVEHYDSYSLNSVHEKLALQFVLCKFNLYLKQTREGVYKITSIWDWTDK